MSAITPKATAIAGMGRQSTNRGRLRLAEPVLDTANGSLRAHQHLWVPVLFSKSENRVSP